MKRLLILILALGCIVLQISCKKKTDSIDPKLIGKWKFVGFISPLNRDTTFVNIYSTCTSCFSLTISNNSYSGKVKAGLVITKATSDGDNIMLDHREDDHVYEGVVQEKFWKGIAYPNKWKAEEKYLHLFSNAIDDTLLFIRKN